MHPSEVVRKTFDHTREVVKSGDFEKDVGRKKGYGWWRAVTCKKEVARKKGPWMVESVGFAAAHSWMIIHLLNPGFQIITQSLAQLLLLSTIDLVLIVLERSIQPVPKEVASASRLPDPIERSVIPSTNA